MFKISVTPSYFAPVTVNIPGEVKARLFEAEFSRLNQAEIADLIQRTQSGDLTDAGLVREVMVGWKGVADESGDALDFTASHLDSLLGVFPVAASIVKAFFDSLAGARVKN